MADVDLGADRLVAARTNTTNLDSRRRPIGGSTRESDRYRVGPIPFTLYGLRVGHHGYPFGFVDADLTPGFGVAEWNDVDFDGLTDNFPSADPAEIRALVYDSDFPADFIQNAWLAELDELELVGDGSAVTFRDSGVYPDGSHFRFRFGSRDYDSLWVGAEGIVSFTGPVASDASRAELEKLHGVIAAAWSDDWDTSRVHVFSGPVQYQRSMRDRSPVKAWAVEWRGLRAPGWDEEQGCSMRLLLFEDGTYRTDFGAMEAHELGAMRLITGYAGPGTHLAVATVDASAHSWGSSPAGSGVERVLAEEIAPDASDIGHVWVRWLGYPERLDPASPAPALASAVRRNGKISVAARGSNIRPGARLVVDGTDAFELKRSKTSNKWVVKKNARALRTGRTVSEIWSDGLAHRVVAVNADGELSESVELE
jgi:hypothetical protein